jgi:hypothetical protein
VRDRFLDRAAQLAQVVRQVVRAQGGLGGHHAAADVDADRGRNHRAQGRDHAADGRALAEWTSGITAMCL